MYYIQKTGANSYYFSPVNSNALFGIEKLPEKPMPKAGYVIVLCVDEEMKKVWYSYKSIKNTAPTAEERLTALEEAVLAMMEVQANVAVY